MVKILLSTELGKQRMTIKRLSELTGVRIETLHELYHDLNDRVSLETLGKICEVLECEISDIIVYDPDYVCPETRAEKAERWRKRHTPKDKR